MIKQLSFICAMLLVYINATSQNIGQYNYKNKMYNIYPFRIDNSEDILLVGYKIPDGEYIAFANYNFKEKFSFKNKKKFVLTDTAIVKGVFSIKNNKAEGSAVFYNYEINDNGKQSHTPYETETGTFINGLKSGVWATANAGKNPTDFTTYKNGIKHGYHWQTSYDGNTYYKEKFCDGDECDTVYSYYNGKINREYDISSIYHNTTLESCYDKGIDLMGIRQNKINTYYKDYDNDGKLEVDLKYKEGKSLPYDSICVKLKNKDLDYFKYVTIKSIDEHHKVLTFKNLISSNQQFEQLFYEDGFLYKSKTINCRKVYGKKSLFGKRKILRIDTTLNENSYFNPDKIISSSVVPIMIVNSIHNNFKTEMYYIPKYKFAFEKEDTSNSFRRYNDNRLTFNRIDTVNKTIYMDSRDYGYYSKYERKSEQVYINHKQEDSNRLKLLAYTKKSYIITSDIPKYYDFYDSYNKNLQDFDTDDYDFFATKKTYYKNDTVLNGQYYFSSISKCKNWPKPLIYTGYTGIEDNMRIGKFVNGKKEGNWTELDYYKTPKKTPLDLKDYFFKHPKKVDGYNESTYKNGMLDGSYTHYQMYNPKEDDVNSKNPIILYKQIESHYTHDTLNGNYKKYFPNGKLMQELNFVMGSPSGECREYTTNGDLECIIHFNKGRLEGKYIKYDNNAILCYANFKNNLLCDSLVYYYSNNLVSEKVYANNDTVSRKVKYFDNGKIKEEVLFNKQSTYTIDEELMLSQSFIETINAGEYNNLRNVNGSFKNYYDSGQLLSEGGIKDGALHGLWKFYSINGVIIHEVNFQDTLIVLPNLKDTIDISGFYTGYYSNGKKRCDGYIKDLEVSYDCFTKQDKADLDFYSLNFFDINGKQTLKNGNGYFIKYESNGLRVASGKLVNCKEDSLWRYYTPEQKLNMIGNYVHNEKDGVWYEGDLEGINFEDGACFDMNNNDEVKAFNQKRKELTIKTTTYRNGNIIDSKHFESNLNKTYKPKRRRGHHDVSF